MPGPSPHGFAMTRPADRTSVSPAQLLLQYLLALELGAAEMEAPKLASTAPHGLPRATTRPRPASPRES
jgi:hypothetical protein